MTLCSSLDLKNIKSSFYNEPSFTNTHQMEHSWRGDVTHVWETWQTFSIQKQMKKVFFFFEVRVTTHIDGADACHDEIWTFDFMGQHEHYSFNNCVSPRTIHVIFLSGLTWYDSRCLLNKQVLLD